MVVFADKYLDVCDVRSHYEMKHSIFAIQKKYPLTFTNIK